MEGFSSETYGPDAYGRAFADVYDEWYGPDGDGDTAAARLVALAGPAGRVLELGVGTGRLALPLAAAGLRVTGIDASPEMLAVLESKPGADAVTTVLADMARLDDTLAPAFRFDLVVCAFNTLFLLPSSDAQQQCLDGAARRLDPGGLLVIDALAPEGSHEDALEGVEAAPTGDITVGRVEVDRVTLVVTRHDRAGQTIAGQHVDLTDSGGVRLRPWFVHYLYPEQLDSMAGRAGLTLMSRHADWDGATFGSECSRHVSVYRRP